MEVDATRAAQRSAQSPTPLPDSFGPNLKVPTTAGIHIKKKATKQATAEERAKESAKIYNMPFTPKAAALRDFPAPKNRLSVWGTPSPAAPFNPGQGWPKPGQPTDPEDIWMSWPKGAPTATPTPLAPDVEMPQAQRGGDIPRPQASSTPAKPATPPPTRPLRRDLRRRPCHPRRHRLPRSLRCTHPMPLRKRAPTFAAPGDPSRCPLARRQSLRPTPWRVPTTGHLSTSRRDRPLPPRLPRLLRRRPRAGHRRVLRNAVRRRYPGDSEFGAEQLSADKMLPRSYWEALYREGRAADYTVIPAFADRINFLQRQEESIHPSDKPFGQKRMGLWQNWVRQMLITVLRHDEP